MKGPRLQLYVSLNGYLLELATTRFEQALFKSNRVVRLGDIVKLEDSKRVPLNSRDRDARKGPYPYYGATSIMDYVDDYLFDGIRVLLGEDGSVIDESGRPILQYVWGKYWVNNHAHILAAASDYSLEAIYIALQRTPISHIVTGAVQRKISQRNLNKLKLEMPDAKSLEYLQDIFAAYRCNCEENRGLVSLRDALLPKLMSGEIDVSKIDVAQLNSHLAEYSTVLGKLFPLSTLKGTVMENAIQLILAQMQSVLNSPQLKRLKTVLTEILPGGKTIKDDSELLPLFLTAKEVEGCSSKTIEYYRSTLSLMTETLAKPYTQIESDDLRKYLNDYEASRGSSKVTIDNIRCIMSSFFSWLEDEDYIVKSPVRRIHRVKTVQVAKEVLTDEDLETLRNVCGTKRDLAVIDLLVSTGMRIGELVKLNIEDVNLAERECLVMGKGNKQRPVYFDARTKLHLEEYLHARADHAPALFVALDSSARRVTIGNLEQRLRKLGKSAGVCHVHPHKFRRTLATHAIDKGMPIEQVQKLLGHAKIDTTMHYAMVNQNNVKASHRKYLE